MARARILSDATRQAGEKVVTPTITMPDADNAVSFFLPKSVWASGADSIELQAERSFDGGKTWEAAGGAVFGRTYHYRGARAGQEIVEPMARFSSRKLGGMRGVLYRAWVEAKGSSSRFALDYEFQKVPFAPQHHSVSIESIDGAVALSTNTVSTGTITPAGSDRGVLVFGANDDGSLATAASMSYAGNAVSGFAYNNSYNIYFRQTAGWDFSDVSSSGVANYTANASQYSINVCAIAVSGLDSWDTAVFANSETAQTISVNVPNMATGDMAIARVFGYADSLSIISGETIEDSDIGYDGGGVDTAATLSEQGTGTVAMGADRGSTEVFGFGILAIRAIAAAGGGGGLSIPVAMDYYRKRRAA